MFFFLFLDHLKVFTRYLYTIKQCNLWLNNLLINSSSLFDHLQIIRHYTATLHIWPPSQQYRQTNPSTLTSHSTSAVSKSPEKSIPTNTKIPSVSKPRKTKSPLPISSLPISSPNPIFKRLPKLPNLSILIDTTLWKSLSLSGPLNN